MTDWLDFSVFLSPMGESEGGFVLITQGDAIGLGYIWLTANIEGLEFVNVYYQNMQVLIKKKRR